MILLYDITVSNIIQTALRVVVFSAHALKAAGIDSER